MNNIKIAGVFISIILLNILLCKWIINRAIHRFIIPDLKSRNLIFIRYKYIFLPDYKEFNQKNSILNRIGPFSKGGSVSLSMCIEVYYKDESIKKVKVKIDTILYLYIKKVTYSEDL